uniref:Uncharacterized protein n=1 Tax=Chromera velia CCMP2878 TaxID=1169474 RepID=A0A0G4F3F2_9ALVE|eukprot:Cvel_2709.t1-p1 / transcript=Cvel_2709.t1 / gene=Cvel_2709 / organism=Chromera_velia_CCMP2878 / gene_product=hypothetical protein / transcript_product=hypothetical protein / location=Cvel_scaffold108:131125-137454(-) / protein_length=692 / sequence_SO=supercontig / SO=protein_coding / is_pseudo=false
MFRWDICPHCFTRWVVLVAVSWLCSARFCISSSVNHEEDQSRARVGFTLVDENAFDSTVNSVSHLYPTSRGRGQWERGAWRKREPFPLMQIFKRCIEYGEEPQEIGTEEEEEEGQLSPPVVLLGRSVNTSLSPSDDISAKLTGHSVRPCLEEQLFITLDDPEASLVKGVLEPFGFVPSRGGEGEVVKGPDGTLIWIGCDKCAEVPQRRVQEALERLDPQLINAPSERMTAWVYDAAEPVARCASSSIAVNNRIFFFYHLYALCGHECPGMPLTGRLKDLEPAFREEENTDFRVKGEAALSQVGAQRVGGKSTLKSLRDGGEISLLDQQWVLKDSIKHGGQGKRFLNGTQVMEILNSQNTQEVAAGPLSIDGHWYNRNAEADQCDDTVDQHARDTILPQALRDRGSEVLLNTEVIREKVGVKRLISTLEAVLVHSVLAVQDYYSKFFQAVSGEKGAPLHWHIWFLDFLIDKETGEPKLIDVHDSEHGFGQDFRSEYNDSSIPFEEGDPEPHPLFTDYWTHTHLQLWQSLFQVQGLGPQSDPTSKRLRSRLESLGVPPTAIEYEVRLHRSLGTTLRPVWPPDLSAGLDWFEAFDRSGKPRSRFGSFSKGLRDAMTESQSSDRLTGLVPWPEGADRERLWQRVLSLNNFESNKQKQQALKEWIQKKGEAGGLEPLLEMMQAEIHAAGYKGISNEL